MNKNQNKYQKIINKTKNKARKRVKIPREITDHITNLTIDMKSALTNLAKIETVKMEVYQSFDSLKQVIRILREKKLLGKDEDWTDIMCEDCKYKRKLMEDVIELELDGVIKGEKEEREIYFKYNDWEEFINRVKERPLKKKVKTKLPEDYKPIKEINIKRKKVKKKLK